MFATLALLSAVQAIPPCLRPTQAGTQVQGQVRVCPGRYRIRDPQEIGVIVVASSGTQLDLSGVTLESGDTAAPRFVGAGIVSRGVDGVSIYGGTIRGDRYGIRLEGGHGHRVDSVTVSGSRAQALRSTPRVYAEEDWLDIFQPDTFEAYGGGVLLKWTDGATVTRVVSRGSQNGIGLFGARRSYVADNDVSQNTGWGIHLWRASHNVIVRNVAHHNVRCESPTYSRGCDSAALLLRERSDSNVVIDNDLRYSGDGFFLSGHRPNLNPSVGNYVARNNASFSYHNAFESTFSAGNTFLDNVADSSQYGFWLGYSANNVVRGNTILGTRTAGIAIEHGSGNRIADNVIIGGGDGIHLFARDSTGEPSRGYHVDDNVLGDLERGIVLEETTQSKLRGNVFDRVTEGLVVDSTGRKTEVRGNFFLRARRWFISAPVLDAGGNYWGAATPAATLPRLYGEIVIQPWTAAAEVGF